MKNFADYILLVQNEMSGSKNTSKQVDNITKSDFKEFLKGKLTLEDANGNTLDVKDGKIKKEGPDGSWTYKVVPTEEGLESFKENVYSDDMWIRWNP